MKNGVFALIEVTPSTATLLMTGDLQRISMHGRILRAEGRQVVGPVVNDQGFCQFSLEQLIHYVEGLGGVAPSSTGWDALGLVETALRLTLAAEKDNTPISRLKERMACLPDPDSDGVIRCKVKAPVVTNKEGKVIPERPKGGTSTTGAVWSIADRLYEENPQLSIKELRKLIMTACAEEEINPGTAGVQYSKWKTSKNL